MARLHDIWEVPDDQAPVFEAALAVGSFPWHKLQPGILRDVGRDHIPAKLSDLSRWAGAGHQHSHGPDEPHVLETHEGSRHRVLGLFWLDYRIEIDQSLVSDPRLLAEVLWSEGAHAIDYALLTDPQRAEIAAALHPNGPDEHTWWEVHDYSGEYNRLMGESFMQIVYEAYTRHRATIQLHHEATLDAIEVTRRILTPELVAPTGPAPFFGLVKSKVVHDDHEGVAREVEWPTLAAALADGRRACRVCRPKEAA